MEIKNTIKMVWFIIPERIKGALLMGVLLLFVNIYQILIQTFVVSYSYKLVLSIILVILVGRFTYKYIYEPAMNNPFIAMREVKVK